VLPYKIRTPQKFPFDGPTLQYDTIFIHDSNEPLDSTLYILAGAHQYFLPHTQAIYPGENLEYLSLNKISVRELMNQPMTQLKSTSAGDDPFISLTTGGPSYYTLNTGTGQAKLDGTGYNNTATDIMKVQTEVETLATPTDHMMDTSITAAIHTYNYSNTAMLWAQSNKRFSMGISRTAISSEADNGEAALRRISYGNPDAATKYLNCSFTEIEDNLAYGANIIATGVCAAQGDSIVTSSNSPYTYTITKVTGTSNCSYNLTVFAAYNGDTIKEFHTQVPLSGTTTHTIDPYFNGTEIAVIVDNGNDGTTDDTLFITGWPVGMQNIINKNGIKVYPNPVSNELNIEWASAPGSYTVSLTDIVGRVVYTNTVAGNKGKAQVTMNPYPTGVYLLQVTDHKGVTIFKDKIVKQ
jgi:hypothetical protein